MEKTYCVYKHTFPNGKIYIGITSQKPEHRWGKDGRGYRRKIKGEYAQPLMAHATIKYNWDDVRHEILYDGLSKERAEQIEIELIACYKSNEREYGYNINEGGHASSGMKDRHLSEETKRKISNALIGANSPLYGKPISDETKRKIGDANRGKQMSEEARQKLSESHKGKPHPKIRRPVVCVETGVIYVSITEASEQTGALGCHISACCKGKRKTAGGYHWEYVDKNSENTNIIYCVKQDLIGDVL